MSTGRVVLAATPIGNVEDASVRLRQLIAEADLVAAEDTRRLRALALRLDVHVTGRVLSLHEYNESERAGEVFDVVAAGGTVLVVSDAGMPTVSDPGFRIVRQAIDRGVPVTTAPGPSAVLAALALSGLPTDRFTFEGFPPRKDGERDRSLAALRTERRTMVFFESPHRVARTLEAMTRAFGGQRQAAVCRELTKTYEEVLRDDLDGLAARADAEQLRGEIAIVVHGAPPQEPAPVADHVRDVEHLVADGVRLKDAVAQVASAAGVAKRELYQAVLDSRAAR